MFESYFECIDMGRARRTELLKAVKDSEGSNRAGRMSNMGSTLPRKLLSTMVIVRNWLQ